jgi:hypothetical protein
LNKLEQDGAVSIAAVLATLETFRRWSDALWLDCSSWKSAAIAVESEQLVRLGASAAHDALLRWREHIVGVHPRLRALFPEGRHEHVSEALAAGDGLRARLHLELAALAYAHGAVHQSKLREPEMAALASVVWWLGEMSAELATVKSIGPDAFPEFMWRIAEQAGRDDGTCERPSLYMPQVVRTCSAFGWAPGLVSRKTIRARLVGRSDDCMRYRPDLVVVEWLSSQGLLDGFTDDVERELGDASALLSSDSAYASIRWPGAICRGP